MTDVEIDPTLLAEVMEECRKDCPDLPDYLVWINSVDMIMRCKGYDNDGTELDHQAKEELEKTKNEFQVI